MSQRALQSQLADGAGRLIGPDEISNASFGLLGGKAGNLLELVRAGLPVPPWFCVTTRVFADVVTPIATDIAQLLAGIEGSDATTRGAVRAASSELGKRLRARGLPAADQDALLARFDRTFAGNALVAVRSSVVGEDSAKDSFAGQMDTFLFVTRELVVERVLDCMASAFCERALLYRQLRGLPLGQVDAAVLVQLMVDSRASGVLFTANPSSGARDEAVVAAGLGLGEGIVGGLVESDTYVVALQSGQVRTRTVVEKRSRVAFDRARGHGTLVAQVPAGEASVPALDDTQLGALIAVGRRVQELRGAPQDIEWALDGNGALFLLQTRPITTLEHARETVFDNSNVVESYPGLSLPLTFSFARAGYDATFRAYSRLVGVPEAILAEEPQVHANLVGLVNGRIYYNILNWYRLALQVPGFEWALPAWEKALGLEPHQVRRPQRTRREKLAGLPVFARVVRRILREFFRMDRSVDAYLVLQTEVREQFMRHQLDELGAHELIELIELIARRLMGPYAISVLNDALTQQLYEALAKLIGRWQLGDATALRNDLLAGETGMESVEPVRSILSLAEEVRADARLRARFESDASEREIWKAIHGEAAFAPFRARLAEHFSRFGDRTLHELKLETPPAEENPAFVVSMLRNYLRGGQKLDVMEQRELAIRSRAEEAVARGLRFHPLRRSLFNWLLARVRSGIKHRENLRLARSRAFGMAKRVYRALGRRFAADRLLDNPLDIFYLTADELAGHVRGHAVTRDLRALVELRRREYQSFAASHPAPRLSARGIVYAKPFASAAIAAASDGDLLRGQGCSPGKVTAAAKIILDPSGDLQINGEILVAPMTDPGWVFLMVAAGGIVSEKGSLLSHTAIIGRELGIPTIVGVKDATALIRDGDLLELDGDTGTVRVIERRQRNT
jgi:pyruvate,water dikinase